MQTCKCCNFGYHRVGRLLCVGIVQTCNTWKSQNSRLISPQCTIHLWVFSWPTKLLVVWKALQKYQTRKSPNSQNTFSSFFRQASSKLHDCCIGFHMKQQHFTLSSAQPLKNYGFICNTMCTKHLAMTCNHYSRSWIRNMVGVHGDLCYYLQCTLCERYRWMPVRYG